jgi:hypothetical protein
MKSQAQLLEKNRLVEARKGDIIALSCGNFVRFDFLPEKKSILLKYESYCAFSL